MPSLDKELLSQKLLDMTKYLGELESLRVPTFVEYKKDHIKRYAVERLIELVVELATDINRHIVAVLGESSPPTYYDTFAEMNNLKILPKNLCLRLASTTGLQNRLVHRYEGIDHKVVYHSIDPLLENYRKYAVIVYDYLEKN
ncbi:MAG: DUF86 domain-containing protein [Chloroflexi bacterium]|nr:DUF86 domain-containing protein [Chloroflexota bacterium]